MSQIVQKSHGTTYQSQFYKDYGSRLEQFLQDETTNRHWQIQKQNMFKLLKPQAGDCFLDIGCGTGKYEIFISPIAAITGLDISEHGLAQAWANIEKYGNPRNASLKLLQAPLRSMGFEKKFNKIFMADSSEHMQPQLFQEILDDAKTLLAADGFLFVYTPNKDHVFERLKPASWTGHINLVTLDGLTRMLVDKGYRIIESYYEVSHVPVWREIERRLPFSFLKRRLCVKAQPAAR